MIVRDTGPGIPAEHLPHIFDRFYKVDGSRAGSTIPSGSGLGLSIVQAIVTSHGGSVTAANAAGGGAEFTIVLPAQAAKTSRARQTGDSLRRLQQHHTGVISVVISVIISGPALHSWCAVAVTIAASFGQAQQAPAAVQGHGPGHERRDAAAWRVRSSR